jgi:O-antigen ligase
VPSEQALRPASRAATAVRALDGALWLLLGALLVEVFFESWVQNLLATRLVLPDAGSTAVLPEWPKTLKSVLYLVLLAVTVAKFTVARRWRDLRTPADLVLVALGLAMIVAGLLGGSSPGLIGDALFVYFRGVLVFYGWRALRPTWDRVVPLLWVVGVILAANVAVALVQMVIGTPSYQSLGWVDLTWSRTYRAQGLLDHPNHLGHALAVALLGLLAWFATGDRVPPKWWAVFGVAAFALSATQSRESAGGFVAGAVLIGLLRRRWRPVLASVVAVVLLYGAQLALRPSNRTELLRRLAGVFSAIEVPSGDEGASDYCIEGHEGNDDCATVVPQREIRVLYAQQGLRLLARQPVFGYGVGQFGGIVAEKNDPDWNLDPRFGPGGFDMHDSPQRQVDTFWLHLTVEAGLVGLVLYLVWLALVARPLLPVARRAATPRGPPVPALAAWALATLLLGVLVAFLSPALEDPLFPPLLFTVLGLAWVFRADEGSGDEGSSVV